jgi:hypothetical protein
MKNKLLSPILLLTTIGILLRVVVYLLLPPAKEILEYQEGDKLFFSALMDHFPEYLRFTSQIPPATFVINAALLTFLGVATTLHIRAFLLLVFLLDIIAINLLFRASKKMESNEGLSFVIMLLFSIVLIPFELWRMGMHYDHFTLFFTAFFAWSLVKLIREDGKWQNCLLVSVTGGLLVSQSAANSIIAPVSVLLILFFVHIPKKQYGKFLLQSVLSVFLPVLILFMISKKNQTTGNESLTSNKGGPAMMMVVQKAYHYDVAKVRAAIQSSGAPEWYIWTYDHATIPIDPVTRKGYDGWINLSQAFGICYVDTPSVSNAPWSFNFHPLLNHLREQQLGTMIKSVETDSAIAVTKPWLFAGYSPELAPGWIGIYGDVSKKIFLHTLLQNPFGMMKAFLAQHAVFALYGPLFPYNTTQTKRSFLAHAALRTLPDPLPLEILFVPATLLFAVTAFITFLMVLLNIPWFLWRLFISNKSNSKQPLFNSFTLLSIPVLGVALVFSCLVGGENDRYFMQAAPYIVILMTCLPACFNDRLARS